MKILVACAATLALIASVLAALDAAASSRASAATPSPTRTKTATRTPTPRGGFFRQTPTPTVTATPVPRVGPADGPGIMLAECVGRGRNSVNVFFLWTPSRSGVQWLDISIFNDGFAPGQFISAGPFAKEHWGYIWEGVAQGVTHYARVNTLTSQGWMAGETLAFYTPVCDAAVHAPPAAEDMLALRDDLDAAVAGSGIDAAVAITDLQTGETIEVQGGARRLPGCTINLFALLHVVMDLQFGLYPEPEPGDLIGQTINRSDPITARNLMKYWLGNGDIFAGLDRVNAMMQSLGMRDTLMDHPPAFWGESLNGGINNRTTVLDMNRGLQAIWDGRIVAPGWRDYLLQKMTLVKPGLNYLIPAGIGYGATASHKNGFLYEEGWADNDIGIVWFERGGRRYGYAISFFTERVPTKYADIPLGQRVSSLAWQWFVGRYGYP